MRKTLIYTYIGTNGMITTPINLEGIPRVEKILLVAEDNKKLTKDNGKTQYTSIKVPKEEAYLWKEIDIPGQN